MKIEQLIDFIKQQGATRVKKIDIATIPFLAEFREACEVNRCGNYGKNYMCPPHIGDINELINEAKSFQEAVVFQQVSQLEDSFDFEGMMAGHEAFNQLTRKISDVLPQLSVKRSLILGAGKCTLCETCAAIEEIPCLYPDKAYSALECYGIYVSGMLEANGIPYNNGENTVSYAGIVLYDEY